LQGSLADSPILNTTYTLKLACGPCGTLWIVATVAGVVNLPADPADPGI
jgi:hypothetical protein